jgi:hypothetical protein
MRRAEMMAHGGIEWRKITMPKFARLPLHIMPGLDGRDIGERSDAVLRTAKPGHDERWFGAIGRVCHCEERAARRSNLRRAGRASGAIASLRSQ